MEGEGTLKYLLLYILDRSRLCLISESLRQVADDSNLFAK
jgi:hypothetical protein